VQVSLVNAEGIAYGKSADLVALDNALNELATFDERQSRIVEMRFFGGLSPKENAELLKISARTEQRKWSLAQACSIMSLAGECDGRETVGANHRHRLGAHRRGINMPVRYRYCVYSSASELAMNFCSSILAAM
jgi:ECF sigma factor